MSEGCGKIVDIVFWVNIFCGVKMKAHLLYLKYVLRHKWFVFLACLDYRIVWLGVIHDWSRFRPSEWIPYAASAPYTKGNKPAAIANAFEQAWNDHQHRNKHHWEYWVHFDYHTHEMRVLPIPDKYRHEMIADWIGAGRAKGITSTWEWYEANKDKMQLHPDTRVWVEHELTLLKQRNRTERMFKAGFFG